MMHLNCLVEEQRQLKVCLALKNFVLCRLFTWRPSLILNFLSYLLVLWQHKVQELRISHKAWVLDLELLAHHLLPVGLKWKGFHTKLTWLMLLQEFLDGQRAKLIFCFQRLTIELKHRLKLSCWLKTWSTAYLLTFNLNFLGVCQDRHEYSCKHFSTLYLVTA